jgi:hypothetical protein
MRRQDRNNRRMGKFVPFNAESVGRVSNDLAFDPDDGPASVLHCSELKLNIRHRTRWQFGRYPSPADADVAETAESAETATQFEANEHVYRPPVSPTVLHRPSVELHQPHYSNAQREGLFQLGSLEALPLAGVCH